MHFASLLENIAPSATLRMNSLALAKRRAGERIFNLSAGEPMVETPAVVKKAAALAIEAGKTRYPPISGLPELRQAAGQWLAAQYGAKFSVDECLVTAGGKFGIYAACQALLNPGDEAILIVPYWVSYPEIVKMFGGTPKFLLTEEKNGWKADAAELARLITPKTKLVFINNGSNPAGALYSREELRALVSAAAARSVTVISDEVYSGLTYDGAEYVSAGSFPEFKDAVVVVQSASKNFAMTGWRVGFVFAPAPLIKLLTTIQGQSTTGASSISQWAALAAVEHAAEITPVIRQEMQTRRDALSAEVAERLGYRPTAAASLYFFISLAALGVAENDSLRFAERALAEANVALVPGAAFGVEGYVRLSFGDTIMELTSALEALAHLFKFYEKK